MNRLWYAAYGSNLHRPRFECYLTGGRPPGASREYPGCRDRSPIPAPRALTLPGEMYFGWHSQVWGGGICFLDPNSDSSRTRAVGYLVTEEQFSDVVAQEMRRSPGAMVDIGPALHTGRHVLGPGRYETLLHCGELDGHPIVTFTSGERMSGSEPSAAYLAVVLAGLIQGHGMSVAAAAAYLAARPGVGCRSAADIAGLLADPTGDAVS